MAAVDAVVMVGSDETVRAWVTGDAARLHCDVVIEGGDMGGGDIQIFGRLVDVYALLDRMRDALQWRQAEYMDGAAQQVRAADVDRIATRLAADMADAASRAVRRDGNNS